MAKDFTKRELELLKSSVSNLYNSFGIPKKGSIADKVQLELIDLEKKLK